ncbi:MAG: carboxymuconolactone decarboxylase family protein [Balneolaceae bacterium]
MKYKIPTRNDVNENIKAIFDNLEKKIGQVPNIYAFTGNSANALQNYLAFSQGQANGTFDSKEREAVFLAVSELNGCEYCLSAHSALGKMNGFTEDEILQLRAGNHPDKKFNVLTRLAAEIQRTHGNPDEELLQEFAGLGYQEDALVDLVSLVINVVFTNYIHNIAGFEIDFPKAVPLTERLSA